MPRKQARFCKGLNLILKHVLLFEDTTFEELVNKAIKARHGNVVLEESS